MSGTEQHDKRQKNQMFCGHGFHSSKIFAQYQNKMVKIPINIHHFPEPGKHWSHAGWDFLVIISVCPRRHLAVFRMSSRDSQDFSGATKDNSDNGLPAHYGSLACGGIFVGLLPQAWQGNSLVLTDRGGTGILAE
jgi:hypothetical protein